MTHVSNEIRDFAGRRDVSPEIDEDEPLQGREKVRRDA